VQRPLSRQACSYHILVLLCRHHDVAHMSQSRCYQLLSRGFAEKTACLYEVRRTHKVQVEQDKPSPPMVMPSETPTVLYCHASMLSFWTFFLISLPRSSTMVWLMHDPTLCCSFARLRFGEPMAHNGLPDAVTYSAYCSIVSTMTTTMWGEGCSLAWIALPPNTCNSNVRLRLHGFLGGYTRRIQHCL
jgi:hypothetical protein